MNAEINEATANLAKHFDIHPDRVIVIGKHAALAAVNGQGNEADLHERLMNFGYVSDDEIAFAGMVAGALITEMRHNPKLKMLVLLKKFMGGDYTIDI